MENSEFKALLERKTEEMNQVLERYLPPEEGLQKTVIRAMNYSVRAGGKRLRPMLMWETFLLCGGREEDKAFVEPFLAAVEMIHTYSLVHDDLPAMDNDRYRRGRETTWAVYGETMGILAGDGLLNYAFETAVRAFAFCGCTGEPVTSCRTAEDYLNRAAGALSVLGRKAGIYGMIGGQTADIEAEGQPEDITEERLLFIHEHKTAALIQASMTIGAILAGAGREQVEALEKCGYNIGIAFQIQDDILDVVGDSAELGKPVGSDEQNGKQTYVTLKGLEQAKKDVAALSDEAVRILEGFQGSHSFLKQLVLELIHRTK
ncbi:MAG: polyprenyl synthetase family protein [Butyrivibrio sp.]|nr:polyprenyl synthetase family protein [Acetatifactor muris]MCM1560645.1 polyprenyl synthetase family protein [Butyrivibrio sp.]